MLDNRCVLVEIRQKIPGFSRFIGSWVYRGKDLVFLVDVGPASSVDDLLAALQKMSIDHVDHVLLTHIHLDHSGGIGTVLKRFPEAHVICHEKGVDHIVDPQRLWEGSLNVLKDRAEAFGKPEGVERKRVVSHRDAAVKGLDVIDTPGHAPHHVAYSYQGLLFPGEAAGNYYVVGDTDFLRPATPPRLFLGTFLKSVDRLLALEDQHMCYAHFGEAESSHHMLQRFRSQILRWEETIAREAAVERDDLVSHCVKVLLREDPELRGFFQLSSAVQDRERYFMENSVRGFLGYLKESSENK
jgi:glyoxylase-like metal-dependent hydrolase (beta-lactamase superfamily II)